MFGPAAPVELPMQRGEELDCVGREHLGEGRALVGIPHRGVSGKDGRPHPGVVHAGNRDAHEDAADDEAGPRYARATDDVEAAACGQDRQNSSEIHFG